MPKAKSMKRTSSINPADLRRAESGEPDNENKGKEFPVEAVQSIIPIKQIYRGMIITEDDRYVKILEVLPINFSLRSAEEQSNIIHLFSGWLRVSPVKLQFKVITRRADTFKIINNVKAQTEMETQPKCRELAKNYIEFIREMGEKESLSRRFLLIFEYEPTSARKRTIDEIAEEMNDAARKIRAGLASCGNEIVIPQNEDYFQTEILYQFYNRRSSTSEQLADRVLRVTSDVMRMNGLVEGKDPYPDIPIRDFIAPRGMDFTKPDYFICDGQYQKILIIRSDGYPTTVFAGWISTLIEAGDGVDVDIIIKRESRQYIRDKVALNLKLNRIKANDRSDVDTDYEQIEGAINSAQYIKSRLSSGEDFYNMHIFITVSADTKDQLVKRTEGVFDLLYSNDIEAKEIKYRLEDAFQITSPLLIYKPELMQMAARNIMTGDIASVYPFTSCELCDENGVVLGINRRYSSLVNLDVFNTKKYKNANISIVGSSGAGKTYTELTMALRMRIQGIQTFIISPDKAHEFRRACAHIDGSFIRISPSSKSCINIMEIRKVQHPVSDLLDEFREDEDDSWLFQKANQLRTFFKLIVPDLSNEEENLVDDCIIKTYARFGITQDNDSIFLDDGETTKTMPIISDLYETIRQNPDLRRVGNILSRFVTGSAQSFNSQTNVDLDNKFIVFDLSDLTENMKAVGMFICMDFLWSKIKENRTERKALYIDEGWQLIGASADSKAADFVYRIFKIIRGYGGSAIFATQDVNDLFAFQDGKYGKAIINNSKIKIILGLEESEAKAVKDILHLSKNEIRNITNFHQGEGLICVNSNKLPVFIRASRLEDELITTDPAQLKEMLEREKASRKVMQRVAPQTQIHEAVKKEKQREEMELDEVKATAKTAQKRTSQNDVIDIIKKPEVPSPAPASPPPTQSKPPEKAPQTEAERAKYYEQEAYMSVLAMEQMEATEITRDMEGKIIPNSENDASIVSVQEEKEIFSEDESELIDKDEAQRDYVKSKEAPKVDNSKDPSLEDKKTAQKQKPLKFLSSFYSDGEGDDF